MNGRYVPKAPKFGGYADSPGWCALYARLASNYIILGYEEDKENKLWKPGNVWNFHEVNNVFWDTRTKGELDYTLLEKGDIIGVKIDHNHYQDRLSERYKFDFNHMATYSGNYIYNGKLEPWIFHNLEGEIKSQSLISFLCITGSEVVQVFKPDKTGFSGEKA